MELDRQWNWQEWDPLVELPLTQAKVSTLTVKSLLFTICFLTDTALVHYIDLPREVLLRHFMFLVPLSLESFVPTPQDFREAVSSLYMLRGRPFFRQVPPIVDVVSQGRTAKIIDYKFTGVFSCVRDEDGMIIELSHWTGIHLCPTVPLDRHYVLMDNYDERSARLHDAQTTSEIYLETYFLKHSVSINIWPCRQ